MNDLTSSTYGELNKLTGSAPKILVITDAPTYELWRRGMVMAKPHMRLLSASLNKLGYTSDDFIFLTPCAPIPEEHQVSDGKINKWVDQYNSVFTRAVQDIQDTYMLDAVLALGKVGNRQLANKAVAITKIRGSFITREATGDLPVLPILSPAHVLTRPENRDIFDADLLQFKSLNNYGWDLDAYKNANDTVGYEWRLDLTELLENPPPKVAIDCETVGLGWHKEGFRVLTVSITTRQGKALVVPTDLDYWNDQELRGESSKDLPLLTRRKLITLKRQLRELLGNPEVSVIGHNLAFDIHALRTLDIDIGQWYADTMQLAFAVDENMQLKSLTECTRRWVPALAGYSDVFDDNTDKSQMQTVTHDDMLEYAGGDTDATFRLGNVLLPLAKQDTRNWKTFTHVQMPALRAFIEMEDNGVLIDKEELRNLEARLKVMEEEAYSELIALVSPKMLRKYEGNWNFGSPDFVRDVLFAKKKDGGLGLIPLVFTKTTAKLPPAERKASTSGKDHLTFFNDNYFVAKLIAYKKLSKMRSTYVGIEPFETRTKVKRLKKGGLPKRIDELLKENGVEVSPSTATRRRRRVIDIPSNVISVRATSDKRFEVDALGNVTQITYSPPTGFWQYLEGSDRIHPSYLLHATVTGRTSSRGPNAQNFPKRGDLAKMFRKIFVAPEGWTLLEADLSQAELRVAGWMANESEMIRIYEQGGDIHSSTAATVLGVSESVFARGRRDETPLVEVLDLWKGARKYLADNPTSKDEQEDGTFVTRPTNVADYCDYKRFQAKAVNFGFLYGMGWRGFKRYAKLDYGIDLTDEEAEEMRRDFFSKYSGLEAWHAGMKMFVKNNGYVRALHGALRRLPSIDSDDSGVQAMSERQAINSPVQRFGSDLGLIALVRFLRDAPKDLVKPCLFIHDANIVAVRNDVADEMASALKFYMETPPLKEWFNIEAPFPIVSDVSKGNNLCDMVELKECEAVAPSWYRSGEEAPSKDYDEVWRVKKRRQIILTDD